MYQELAEQWLKERQEISTVKLSPREENIVRSFAAWLSTDAGYEAAQQTTQPTKPNVGAGSDFAYILSQQIRDK